MAMATRELQDGQEGYVVSMLWLQRVWARASEDVRRLGPPVKTALDGEIGPVDNSDLLDLGKSSTLRHWAKLMFRQT